MRRRWRRHRAQAAAALTGAALLLAGCAQSVDPIERLGEKAAQRVRHPAPARDLAYRHWGLRTPLPPAPNPPARVPLRLRTPRRRGPYLPPVVDHVPTPDKVVFLTYDTNDTHDDGEEKDPRFADMVRELRLPVTAFRTDSAEICDRRQKLRPHLFRPPHGTYDTTTLHAAADCGVSAVVLWRASMTTGTLTYTRGPHHLRPGDIIQMAPEAPTAQRLLRKVQSRGLTVGRLEDYI
ncbi:hypothetical protein ABZ915_27990 [Streptomyces sp. NPDC046915]|uniref:hypothetical protein n=1 Tax=Streptomyces sp. NPDC046915 TaxID=3155257 RepID=UPI0033E760A4